MNAAAPVGGRRAALAFIFVTILLDFLALASSSRCCRTWSRTSWAATPPARKVYGVFGTVWALMQFLAMPVLGALSDRYGRRPVILLSNLGLGLAYVLMALAPNLAWLFVARVISGITAASVSTGMAYIADVTPPERRSASFGKVGVAFGLGFILGPAIGGLLGSVDPRLPFWGLLRSVSSTRCMGCSSCPNRCRPRSGGLSSGARQSPGIAQAAALAQGSRGTRRCGVSQQSRARRDAVHVRAVCGLPLRVGRPRRRLRVRRRGHLLGARAGRAGGARVRRLGERRVLLTGLTFGALGFLVYGLAPTGALFLAAVPVVALWGLASPAAQGLMTRHVGPNEQGALQGAAGSIMGSRP